MLMSPLERMSGSLCDAVTGSEGSQRRLESLRADTHLIHRVDHDDTWFAMNKVLRNSLLGELDRNEPETLRTVHARAAEWYEDHDMPSTAIEHALRADEPQVFARLMGRLIKNSYANGQVADVLKWMAWLQRSTDLDRYPHLAAGGALVHIQEGDSLAAEEWVGAAVKGTPSGEPHPAVQIVRALGTRTGTAEMINASREARARMEAGSEWTPAALLIEGMGHIWDEDLDTAEPLLAESAELGERNESWPTTSLALAELGLIAISRKDWDTASDLADKSLRIIDTHRLDGYMTSGLGLVVAARCARSRSEIAEARTLLARSASVRPRLSSAVPGVSVQTLLEMARAHLELSDVSGTRTLIREASDVLAQRPDLGRLPQAVDKVREILILSGPGKVGPTALTKAELRLLPLLATNLSFPEIGDQLFISRHTVKTQAMSIYRKLGKSSRSDAVAKAHDTGLLNR
jgi:LuxR family maltose regulon positive regulatory protein